MQRRRRCTVNVSLGETAAGLELAGGCRVVVRGDLLFTDHIDWRTDRCGGRDWQNGGRIVVLRTVLVRVVVTVVGMVVVVQVVAVVVIVVATAAVVVTAANLVVTVVVVQARKLR